MRQWDLRQGDARQVLRTLSEASIQCVVTSPPYWGLRDYSRCECNSEYQRRGEEHPLPEKQGGTILQREADPDCPKCHGTGKDDSLNVVWGKEDCEHRWGEEIENPHRNRRTSVGGHLGADKEGGGRTTAREQTAGSFCSLCPAWRGQLGLEPTPDLYVQHIIAVFREVRRVLRDDGTLWLNMGDCYAGAKVGNTLPEGFQGERVGRPNRVNTRSFSKQVPAGLKTKDLIGMPWRVAFALQADGWWLRSDIIWAKPNPMPESVTDRPTRSHEYIFLLTRKARYFYDADAVREPQTGGTHARYGKDGTIPSRRKIAEPGSGIKANASFIAATKEAILPHGRNKRTVWEITTQPYPEAHFATFPEKLVEPCIQAGTPEKSACSVCGSPWERVVERTKERVVTEAVRIAGGDSGGFYYGSERKDYSGTKAQKPSETKNRILEAMTHPAQTTGFRPTCAHDAPTQPATVLDPFCGSGSAGVVAVRLGRRFLGIDIKAEYLAMAERRLRKFPVRLDTFAEAA